MWRRTCRGLTHQVLRYDGGSISSLESSLARSRTAVVCEYVMGLYLSTPTGKLFRRHTYSSFDLEVSSKLGGVVNPDETRGLRMRRGA